eukprot:171423_1
MTKTYSGPTASSFPLTLMEILDNEDISDIISWLPHSKGFVILDKDRFANEILPRYFKVAKFSSFNRRMKRWKFNLQRTSRHETSYSHPQFIRHKISDCLKMRPLPQNVVNTKKMRNPTVFERKPDGMMKQAQHARLQPFPSSSFVTPTSPLIQNLQGPYSQNVILIESDKTAPLPYSFMSTNGINHEENMFQPDMEGLDTTLLRNYYNHYLLETYTQHQFHLSRQMEAAHLSLFWSMKSPPYPPSRPNHCGTKYA